MELWDAFVQNALVKTGGPLFMMVFVIWRFLQLDTTRADMADSLRGEVKRLTLDVRDLRRDGKYCSRENHEMRRLLSVNGIDTSTLIAIDLERLAEQAADKEDKESDDE